MEEKIQVNVVVYPEIKRRIEALGKLTNRSNNADVVSWLVNLKYDELFAPRTGGNGHEGDSLVAKSPEAAGGE